MLFLLKLACFKDCGIANLLMMWDIFLGYVAAQTFELHEQATQSGQLQLVVISKTTLKTYKKFRRCRPCKMPPCHTSPIHGCDYDDAKSLHNNKNGKKPNLNKPQIAILHTKICIPMQNWIQHQSSSTLRICLLDTYIIDTLLKAKNSKVYLNKCNHYNKSFKSSCSSYSPT